MDIDALAAILEPGFSVQEALEMILADDKEEFESDIFIVPPEPSLVSDEDSGDEDSGGDFNNFNRNQLLVDAELRPRVLTDRLPDTGRKQDYTIGDLMYLPRKFSKPNYERHSSKSIVELFELFIDDDLISFLVEKTNRYASFLNSTPNITEQEIKCFIGILLLSGYNRLPCKRMYWEHHEDGFNVLVFNAMRRNRFEQILRFLHLANNDSFLAVIKFEKCDQ